MKKTLLPLALVLTVGLAGCSQPGSIEDCIDDPGDKSILQCIEAVRSGYDDDNYNSFLDEWRPYERMRPKIDRSKENWGSWIQFIEAGERNLQRGFELLLISPDVFSSLKTRAEAFLNKNRGKTAPGPEGEGWTQKHASVRYRYGAASFDMEKTVKISLKDFVIADRVCETTDLPVTEAVATDCLRREIRYLIWRLSARKGLPFWHALIDFLVEP